MKFCQKRVPLSTKGTLFKFAIWFLFALLFFTLAHLQAKSSAPVKPEKAFLLPMARSGTVLLDVPIMTHDKKTTQRSWSTPADAPFPWDTKNIGAADPFSEKERMGMGNSMIGPEIFLNFSLDWTMCNIHGTDGEPFTLLLTGSISSNANILWTLTDRPSTDYYCPPSLGLIWTQQGTEPIGNEPPIPLNWQISIDNGPFVPMTVQGSVLSVNIAPGTHTFQVQITATPQPFQPAGQYYLLISMCLVQQL